MSHTQKVVSEDLNINLRVEGSGRPLLYLGGSNFDLSIKAPVFSSELTTHFTVAAYDPRGLGQTDAPPGDWTMLNYANDALLVMDWLGWNQVDVLGESFGAMTALHLALLAPKRINRLALAAGSPGGAGGSSYPIHRFQSITDPVERARASLSVLDSRFEALQCSDPEEAECRLRTRVASDAAFMESHHNRSGYPRLLKARATHNCWTQLPKIKSPTLIFAGRYDQQAPLACSQNMERAIAFATLEVVDSCHSLCFTSPQPVASIVKHWTTNPGN